MLLVPRWDDNNDADRCIQHLVDTLLRLMPFPAADVRRFSSAVAQQVILGCSERLDMLMSCALLAQQRQRLCRSCWSSPALLSSPCAV